MPAKSKQSVAKSDRAQQRRWRNQLIELDGRMPASGEPILAESAAVGRAVRKRLGYVGPDVADAANYAQVLGWASAEFCSRMERGEEPCQIELPSVLANFERDFGLARSVPKLPVVRVTGMVRVRFMKLVEVDGPESSRLERAEVEVVREVAELCNRWPLKGGDVVQVETVEVAQPCSAKALRRAKRGKRA